MAIIVGLSLVMLVGFAGLALDLGRPYVNKTELQTALKRQGEVSARLAEQEEAWLLVHMEIEALEAELGQAG